MVAAKCPCHGVPGLGQPELHQQDEEPEEGTQIKDNHDKQENNYTTVLL